MSATTPPLPEFDAAPRACAEHPARPAAGLCRSCLKGGCGECLTKADGTNLCATCLAKRLPTRRLPPELARMIATRPSVPRSIPRALIAIAIYGFAALAAAGAGVALPFFGNERLLQANRDRVAEVAAGLSRYDDDVGHYPDAKRGLDALLAPDAGDRDAWKGPYTTERATSGRGPQRPAFAGHVLDAFGRPILYVATADPDDPGADPKRLYLASPGANGVWDTPGAVEGKAPHDPAGDDVLQWVLW